MFLPSDPQVYEGQMGRVSWWRGPTSYPQVRFYSTYSILVWVCVFVVGTWWMRGPPYWFLQTGPGNKQTTLVFWLRDPFTGFVFMGGIGSPPVCQATSSTLFIEIVWWWYVTNVAMYCHHVYSMLGIILTVYTFFLLCFSHFYYSIYSM